MTWDDIENRKCTVIDDVERYQILGLKRIVFHFVTWIYTVFIQSFVTYKTTIVMHVAIRIGYSATKWILNKSLAVDGIKLEFNVANSGVGPGELVKIHLIVVTTSIFQFSASIISVWVN